MTFPLFDPDIANYGQARAAACIVPPSSSCPVSLQSVDSCRTPHTTWGWIVSQGYTAIYIARGTQQYTYSIQLPDCFFMTNILPGSHRAEYIISLQAYLCMDGKFLFEHQSSYQLFQHSRFCIQTLSFRIILFLTNLKMYIH